ncbi:MAG TPA: YceH family protein [Cellvibrio sp.]|nr:YceH family protein [Cellvibrio sp.]
MNSPESETETSSTEPLLTEIEARILGALMEKQLATPDAYPLTLNSLVLACNQKTSREPITNLESGEVQRCLSQMQDKKLIEVDYGSRANRYDQRLTRVLSLDKSAQAILNVMLLRGPQTLVELLTRTQRMFDFSSLENLQEKLDQLCAKTHPVIMRIPRQPGQREERYMHLLCGKPDLTAIAAMGSSAKKSASPELEERVEKLEVQVEQLQKLVDKLLDLNGFTLEDLQD